MNSMAIYRIARALRLRQIGVAASFLDMLNYLVFGCVVPSYASIGKNTSIEHRGVAVVINRHAVIGDNCTIGAQVVIGGRGKAMKGAPEIGNGVYLGAGCKILGPVRVGDGATVGANSVVLNDVPAQSTAVGVPARILPREV
jgi:serine O-acetyltransferase